MDRGFCSSCGTPLTFAHRGADYIDLAVGSLDDPEVAVPEIQIGIESRVSWTGTIPGLKENTLVDVMAPDRMARIATHQHPDHDTETWTVRGES